jgi:hypothetical protein
VIRRRDFTVLLDGAVAGWPFGGGRSRASRDLLLITDDVIE